MKLISFCLLSCWVTAPMASDHNNLEGGRPLRFDDAYSIAFRERSLSFGFSADVLRERRPDYGVKAEYKVGFAKNRDFALAVEPVYIGEADKWEMHRVELSYFQNLRREIGSSPALGFRIDAELPGQRGDQGVDVRIRGIATTSVSQFGKLHLNVDVTMIGAPGPGEREAQFGAILGYSTPLGYPRDFNQTLVAELGIQDGAHIGERAAGFFGLGLRRQTDATSILDVGFETDISGLNRQATRLIVGYSRSF